ncbi:MAG: nucleoside-diphosphate-sugar pyrophosphorylase [Akkermansiaceae bacterium]|nr:nucleoside-diphosphate-sugar pyrophosphorylase [Akkermansiaceae bacterium]
MTDYIIVQAGGRGSRLEILTTNKPKALVPIDNLPMLFHLFKKYPNAHFKIIADYQKETLKRYLKVFATVNYEVIETDKKGTCSGINDCLKNIPSGVSFMLIWCDLVLSNIQQTELLKEDSNYIGISKDFTCRWSYKDNKFEESPSAENGVAGMFIFKDKSQLSDVPEEGEFVRYLSQKDISFNRLNMYGGIEIGTMLSYFQNELNKPKCRPFNKIEFKGDIILKYPLNEQGRKLAQDELAWYKKASDLGYRYIPQIYGYDPLVMNKIKGQNLFDYGFLTNGFKKALLEKIVSALNELHHITPPQKANSEDCENNYITKTFERLAKVYDLVPFAQNDFVIINEKKCTNIFAIKEKIIADVRSMYPDNFHFIHGDCTFHNMMIETETVNPVLIDPRGYFGKTKFYGDIDYDWAKLYYSVVGNYDQFNRKNFSLEIKENKVDLMIISNNWEQLEDYFFEITKTNRKKIKLLHAIIWLSLTTYAWEDYDAICGAFYKGLLELQTYLDYAE